jgi:beta-lactamase regulating signal transducer with metallopeptidase domain
VNGLNGFRTSPGIDAIGWALLHSLWQGAAIAVALAIVLGLLHRATAQARYVAACAAMVLLIALPVFTLLRSAQIIPNTTTLRAPDRVLELEPSSSGAVAGASARNRPWHSILDGPRPFLPAVVAIWTVGIAVFSLRLAGGVIQARRWVRIDTCAFEDSMINRLCDLMEIRCGVAIFKSSRVAVPMVVGWLRPAILVPVAALSGLTPLEMEAILAHELAHIRRHDYLMNLVQCAIETLMFHHPATWWISRVIRREREHCCDDMAILACRDRFVYARALAAMEGLRAPAFSLSPAASGGNLLARIRRILNPVEESMKLVRILIAMVVVMAFVPIWLVRAGDKTEADPGSPRSKPVKAETLPGRTFADIIASIDEAPMGSFTVGVCRDPNERLQFAATNATPQGAVSTSPTAAAESNARNSQPILEDHAGAAEQPPTETEVWEKVNTRDRSHDAVRDAEAEKTFNLGAYYKKLGKVAAAEYFFGKVSRRWPNSPWSVKAKADLAELAKTPPTQLRGTDAIDGGLAAERSRDQPSLYTVERNNVRIVIEKIGDKVDPVKVYPLAGPCQLVHRHYKCTVYFDEVFRADGPIPFNHVNHMIEVVYIDKDFLRRAAPSTPANGQDEVNIVYQRGPIGKRRVQSNASAATSRDERIDGIVREIEQLKAEAQIDRHDQERVLDGLIKELESLKKSAVNKK